MLKFILFVIVVFLVLRMVMRFFKMAVFRKERDANAVRSHMSQNIEEADYEVLDSRLAEKEEDGQKGV
ncbi:MAG: hypothetical protein JZU72_02460 [Chlorobium phaeobacteroides]|jgi:uncharacterized protein (UPF0333 family)|nr:hypothetical protein [Chlorobium phaeobacteroides]